MTAAEIDRLVGLAAGTLGVRKVRFNRVSRSCAPTIVDIVRRCSAHDVELSITTNAIGLANRARGPGGRRLRRVNVSLDTVDPDVLRRGHPRPFLDRVLEGIAAAAGRSLGSSQRRAAPRGERPPSPSTCSPGASSAGTSCASSSRCRSTRARLGRRHHGHGGERHRALLGEHYRSSPTRRRVTAPPPERYRVSTLDGEALGTVV